MLSSQELLKIAGEEKPEVMEKIAAIVYTLEKTNPDIAQEVVGGMRDVAEYTSEKLAAQGYGPMARFGAGVVGGIATGLAGNMVGDLYDVAKRGLSKGRNFRQIMQVNPDLKLFDKKKLQLNYNTLHRYAPDFTADPVLGGGLLKALADVEGNEQVVIRDLLASRKNLQDIKGGQFRMGPTQAFELPSHAEVADAEFERQKFQGQSALKQEELSLKEREVDTKDREYKLKRMDSFDRAQATRAAAEQKKQELVLRGGEHEYRKTRDTSQDRTERAREDREHAREKARGFREAQSRLHTEAFKSEVHGGTGQSNVPAELAKTLSQMKMIYRR